MALLAFEKAPFSAIFSLSIQMSSNQVNVAPETADGAIVAGPGPKSCLAKEIGNGALRKSAKKRHFVAAVSRGRGDAGDGVRHPAADRPDGSRPLERRIEGALCLWNLLNDLLDRLFRELART